jgi:hypothetical protein
MCVNVCMCVYVRVCVHVLSYPASLPTLPPLPPLPPLPSTPVDRPTGSSSPTVKGKAVSPGRCWLCIIMHATPTGILSGASDPVSQDTDGQIKIENAR